MRLEREVDRRVAGLRALDGDGRVANVSVLDVAGGR
jgi:hypothetical protein